MNKILFAIAFFCSLGINAQTIKTFSSCDTNTDSAVTIADVTNTTAKILGKDSVVEQNMVTAKDLQVLLDSILTKFTTIEFRLDRIEKKLGIGIKDTPDCEFAISSYTLKVGKTFTQTVTTTSDGAVTYSSSDESVATVDQNGLVTAIGEGNATITANIASTETHVALSAQYSIIVEAKPQPTDFTYVDLGLPSGVLWATCNIGAKSPEEYGDYYAWGEVDTKLSYTKDNYFDSDDACTTFNKYNTDAGKTTLDSEDDAARENWGGTWRMPTANDCAEIDTLCTWTWGYKNGIYGYIVTSNVEGYTDNSIFLPVAGYYTTRVGDAGFSGHYWSATLSSTNSAKATSLYFTSFSNGMSNGVDRYAGRSIRPVQDGPKHETPEPTTDPTTDPTSDSDASVE